MAYEVIDTRALAQLRRDIKAADPAVRKTLDRELRGIARGIAKDAARFSPRLKGDLAGGWKPSVTQGKGVAVINRQPHARVHEYGGIRHLRRGRMYLVRGQGGGTVTTTGKTGRPLPVTQVTVRSFANGTRLVQNEAAYLIRRSQPGTRALRVAEATTVPQIADACARAVDRALS